MAKKPYSAAKIRDIDPSELDTDTVRELGRRQGLREAEQILDDLEPSHRRWVERKIAKQKIREAADGR